MTIPDFPGSRPILLDDKPLFDSIFTVSSPEISAYTFTNLFAWRIPYNSSVSRLGEHLIVHHQVGSHKFCLEPIGLGDARGTMEEVFERAGNGGGEFERVHSRIAKLFEGDPRFAVELNRDDFDYVYSADDLIHLRGARFDGKRNFINRIRGVRDYEYVEMTPAIAASCEEFADYWCEERSCETEEGLRREQCAVYQMLTNFEALRIRGGAIVMDGRIVAFSLGEALNPETLVIHVERADLKINGLYQLINNEFCIREAAGFRYVNREQDLGVPGLRKAKESYHPVMMVEAWRVRRVQP